MLSGVAALVMLSPASAWFLPRQVTTVQYAPGIAYSSYYVAPAAVITTIVLQPSLLFLLRARCRVRRRPGLQFVLCRAGPVYTSYYAAGPGGELLHRRSPS